MSGKSIINPFCLAFLSSSIREANFAGCFPFSLRVSSGRVEYLGRPRRYFAWLNGMLTFALPLAVFLRLYYLMMHEHDGSGASTTLGLVSVFGGFMLLSCSLYCYHTQTHHRKHKAFINAVLDFFADLLREHNISAGRNGKIGCERYLQVLRVFLHFSVLSYFSILINRPHRPTTMMSLFDNPKDQSFFWPVTVLNMSILITGALTAQYLGALDAIYICALDTAVNGVRAKMTEYTIGKERFVSFYRSVQLLQREYNVLFGSWLLPAQHHITIAVVTICVFGMVAIHGYRSTYAFICIYEVSKVGFVYVKMGQLQNDSMVLLELNKRMGDGRGQHWFRRFLKSCRPIVVRHGHLFNVDKGLILTLCDVIVANAVNLLVTYG